MSTYTGQTPTEPKIDTRIVKFFENFYAVSDNPSDAAHEEYTDQLTDDATLVMGSRKGTGRNEILRLRKSLWSGPVKTRKHHLNKIFPFGTDSKENMLYGTVDYGLHNGKSLTVDWSARAVFEDKDKLRMKFYQVYLDSAPVAQAVQG